MRRYGTGIHVIAAVGVLFLTGCVSLTTPSAGRNWGAGIGSDGAYPDYKGAGGYYYPTYSKGEAPGCFGETPAYIPGCYPGIYDGFAPCCR